MQVRTKRLLLAAVVIVIAGLGYLALTRKPANLNLVVSPYAASVVIDGTKHVHEGKLYVIPGNHRLTASFNGFSSETVSFKTGNTMVNLNVLLNPSSRAGYDWLNSHPDDVTVRQNIGGTEYNKTATALLRDFPIVADLPSYGAGGEYEISYGQTTTTKSGSQVLEIDIIYYTIEGKQAGLQWLQSQPYNLSKFNIEYIDKTSQYTGVDNPGTH